MSQDFINEADDNVIIPIYGGAESLNVAMATGIIYINLGINGDKMDFKHLNKKKAFENNIITVYEEDLLLPNGNQLLDFYRKKNLLGCLRTYWRQGSFVKTI